MFEKVDNRVNFVHVEHEMLKLWDETDAFNKLREQNAGKEPWSFLDGPITANNPMGVHHAWGRTLKDAFHRYFAMKGHECRYQNGFDCQGLWVEIEVEKELNIATKKEIEDFGLAKFTEACKKRVYKYSDIQSEQSKRLGYWMDWNDSYFTMSEENNYTIWTFLKKCHERGLIYKGTDVMPWSGRAGTAYSDMEVRDGRKLTSHTSVFVRLPIRERENEYLLIWTTTPWTLTSNVGVAVNGELEYAKIQAKRDGAIYYLAKENLKYKRLEKEYKEGFPPFGSWPKDVPKLKTLEQIFKEQGGFEVLETVPGSELVGLTYDGPFDELEAQQRQGGYASDFAVLPEEQRDWPAAREAHKVIDPGKDAKGNAYVVAGEGTGLVHTAPGCGDVDHKWGLEHQLVAIAPLDEEGKFIEGFGELTGMDAADKAVAEKVIESLRKKGLLVATEEYPHIYPHCWRTGVELVYRLVDEWYISMDWREQIMAVAKQMEWLPPEMHGEERELNWLENMRDWMISKKRYWGLALPIWECEKCAHFDVIGSREELQERATGGWDKFDGNTPHRPYVDAVTLTCPKCSGTMRRIPDVGNPWLDAGIVAFSTTKYNTDRDYWKHWIPADLVLECFPGQFRNWFYAILAMSTMMENIPPAKRLVGHALVMDEEGRQMHKSDGTAIWFEEAAEQLGVDTMRWMYCAQPYIQDLRFGTRHPGEEVNVELPGGQRMTHTVDGARLNRVTSKPADHVRYRVLTTLWNSYSFFANYARLSGFDANIEQVPLTERPDIDRWILSELQRTVRACREAFDSYNTQPATKALDEFIDQMSNWYIRRNRGRFWRGENASKEEQRDSLAAFQTLYEVLVSVAKLAAPVIPFVTESMYQNLVRRTDESAPVSVHLCAYPEVESSKEDTALSERMNAVVRLVSLGRAVRANVKIGVRQPLPKILIVPRDAAEREAAEQLAEQIREELNVKTVEVQNDADFLTLTLKPNFKTLGPKVGKKMKQLPAALEQLDARQALKELAAGALKVELEGETLELTEEDIQVDKQTPEHLAVADDPFTVVALDTTISEELAREGLARDFTRAVQDLRKQVGLEIEDRIRLAVETDDETLRTALKEHRPTIMEDLLAVEMTESLRQGAEAHTLKVRKAQARVAVEKKLAPDEQQS